MPHSIIIPHRNRNRFLEWCIWSIERSAAYTGVCDYQIIVVDANSEVEPEPPTHGCVLHDRRQGRLFNKSRCLNIGMALAFAQSGDNVVTFLDADAIVGPRWLEGIACLESPCLTRLCYRTRLLWLEELDAVDRALGQIVSQRARRKRRIAEVNGWFIRYHERVIHPELYGTPDGIYNKEKPAPPFGPHVFGNSQFSMRQSVIGDLRWNEAFEGRGREDQWFIREVWRRAGKDYCAALLTDPDFAIVLVHNPILPNDTDDWNNQEAIDRNIKRYEES